MNEDQESAELRKYIEELKTVRSEAIQIIREQDNKTLSKAASYYPQKVNQLLTQRNIVHASGLFPFFDLAFFNQRKRKLDLLDLNTEKDDLDQLWEVVRRIDKELNEL